MGDEMMPGSNYTVPEALTGQSVFGKPSNYEKEQTREMMQRSLDMSNQLWEETGGMRGNISKLLEDYTAGRGDITKHPMFAGGMAGVNDAYSAARDRIIADTPAGGALTSELGNLAVDRAKAMTDLISNIQSDMFNKAYGAGYGTPQTSIAGAGQAGQNAMNYLVGQQQMGQQNAQGFGQMLGYMMSKGK